jgi:hypothetical protein
MFREARRINVGQHEEIQQLARQLKEALAA